MKTITHDGTTYKLPFADLFRELTTDERSSLTVSIGTYGVRHRVLTYDSPTHGPDCVIDGGNRLEIGTASGRPVPVEKQDGTTDDAARELAESLNADRRHLTAAELAERRAKRVERVAGKRAEGKSIRTIAAEEKVSPVQVQRDLEAVKESGVPPGTPEPAKVIGRDGKAYPATTPDDFTTLDIPFVDYGDDEEEGGDGGDDTADDESWTPTDADADRVMEEQWAQANEEAEARGESTDPASPSRKAKPKWMTAGNKIDPDHPFAKLLSDFSTLSAKLTVALGGDDEHAQKLKTYLSFHKLVHHRSLWINGKKYGARFVGFRAVRKLVKLAGLPGRIKTAEQIKKQLDALEGDE